jgi:hypothetical protein
MLINEIDTTWGPAAFVQVAAKTPVWASGAAFIPLYIADCETVVPTRAPEKGHKDAFKYGLFCPSAGSEKFRRNRGIAVLLWKLYLSLSVA